MLTASIIEGQIKATEVYRNTPFEHMLTAEPLQLTFRCAWRVAAAGVRIQTVGAVKSEAPLLDLGSKQHNIQH